MEHDEESKIRDFIDHYIDSVEQLEILLLLKESSPKSWTSKEINEKLQSHLDSVKERLEQLCILKLITCQDSRYFYPGEDRVAISKVEAVAQAYRQKRIRVIEMIFSRPKNKLKDFSNAFKLRKGPKDG